MGTRLGAYVQRRLDEHDLSQNRFAKLSGVSQGTISNIIRGQRNTDIVSLWKLARSFGVEVTELVQLAVYDLESELGIKESVPEVDFTFYRPGKIPPSFKIQVKPGQTYQDLERNGSRLESRGEWKKAVVRFFRAYEMAADPAEKTRILAEKIAQMYTNLGAYNLSTVLLNHAEILCTAHGPGEGSPGDPGLLSAIYEKRGWNESFRGNYELALANFRSARAMAQAVDNKPRQSTTFHFDGRAQIESQMTRLYPGLSLPEPPIVDADAALNNVAIAKDFDENLGAEPTVAFDLQWEARGRLLQGDVDGAVKILQRTASMFGNAGFEASVAESLLELARLELLASGSEAQAAYVEIKSIVDTVLFGYQHPYAVARSLALLAYSEFIRGKYHSNAELRRESAEACDLVMRLHPYPNHPLFQIAQAMKQRFVAEMDEGEPAIYEAELNDQVRDTESMFYWWLNRSLHTNEDEYQEHREMVYRTVGIYL